MTCEEVDASFRQRSNAPPVRPLICPVPARVTRRPMSARPPVRSSEDICSAQPETGSAGATGRGPPEGRQRAGPGRARSSGGRARSSGGRSCSSGGRARSSGGPGPQPVVPSTGPQRVLVLSMATATRDRSCAGPTRARASASPLPVQPAILAVQPAPAPLLVAPMPLAAPPLRCVC